LEDNLTGHNDRISSVVISPDGQTLVSASGDTTVKIWDLKTGTLLRTLTGHYAWVSSIAISPDSQTLVSGSYDKTIKVWRMPQ
jgi:WD40 repeat protein